MFQSPNCLSTVLKTRSLFSNIYKTEKFKLGPVRPIFKRLFNKKDVVQREKERPKLTDIDDPRFTEYFVKDMFNLQVQKEGFRVLFKEFAKLHEEGKTNFKKAFDVRVDSKKDRIDLLFKFENEKDLEGCSVSTDSSFNMGYSSASFKLTENETAIFSGQICADTIKTGMAGKSGFANLSFPQKIISFFRVEPYDFVDYTHLVLKIRGDGRIYMVLLHLPLGYKEAKYNMYIHQLYTRGGPYWQIVKIPFHHFWHSLNGRVLDKQYSNMTLYNIEKVSITVAGFEGPFKLEIDYIGLEYKEFQKAITPYEQYSHKVQ